MARAMTDATGKPFFFGILSKELTKYIDIGSFLYDDDMRYALRPTHGGRHRVLLASTHASWHAQEGHGQGRAVEHRRGPYKFVN
jgi:hypothetical protein